MTLSLISSMYRMYLELLWKVTVVYNRMPLRANRTTVRFLNKASNKSLLLIPLVQNHTAMMNLSPLPISQAQLYQILQFEMNQEKLKDKEPMATVNHSYSLKVDT